MSHCPESFRDVEVQLQKSISTSTTKTILKISQISLIRVPKKINLNFKSQISRN